MSGRYVVGLDQGTTSTRALIFDEAGRECGRAQRLHRQHFPEPGFVEHDAKEILANAIAVLSEALEDADIRAEDVAALGIANQTETIVVWDRRTGEPVHRAITWQDTRGATVLDLLRGDTGAVTEACMVAPNDYFAATKIRWILDNVPGTRESADDGHLAFGGIESWLCWNLSGGVSRGVHVTDVSNASRTLLMDMTTLQWSDQALTFFGVPRSMLPAIVPTSAVVAVVATNLPLPGVPIAALMGDQQAATFGHTAFARGEAKCTYGTGTFLIYNTGTAPQASKHGLIPTVIYKLGDDAAVYGLEGSAAVTGSLVQWLRDSLHIPETGDIEELAASVPDTGGVTIVPAFSGLYAPYWEREARGLISGLTHYATSAHIARAALESCALQTADLVQAAEADADIHIDELRVDGGATRNGLLMQMQADVLGRPVSRLSTEEATALGVAYNAGLAVGMWSDLDELKALWNEAQRWTPQAPDSEREATILRWGRAVHGSIVAAKGR